MSYHIYTTKALILSHTPRREADRIYSLLTRDLGLIRASAGGVRKISSKLRGSLEPLAFASVSLVRGKEFWRITSVEFIQRVEPEEAKARPLALLEQLVQGETAHPELFDKIERLLTTEEDISTSPEVNLVAHILFHLGYLKEEDLKLEEKKLIRAINSGLKESGLTS